MYITFKQYEWLALSVCSFVFYTSTLYASYVYGPKPQRSEKSKKKDEELSKQEFWHWYIEYWSWIHAISCIVLGGYSIYTTGTRATDKTTDLEYVVMMNSMGYFAFDCVVEIYLGIIDTEVFIHHLCGIIPMLAAVFLDNGGSSIVAFTFWSELSNPFYLSRDYYKQIGMEETIKCQIWLWGYAFVFIYARSYMFYVITRDAISTPVNHVFLKFWLSIFVFLSHGWLLFLCGMLWKSLPIWFPDPEKARKYHWWIRGRQLYAKYIKGQPYFSIFLGTMFVTSGLTPFLYGWYVNYQSYIENQGIQLIS